MRWVKALLALVGLAALVVVPPTLLAVLIGSPIPSDLFATTTLGSTAIVQLLSLLVWALWGQTLWCIVVEIFASFRSTSLVRAPGTFGFQQQAVRVLVAAIAAAFVITPGAGTEALAETGSKPTTTSHSTHQSTRDLMTHSRSGDVPEARQDNARAGDPISMTRVERGDTLWSLAERHLGSGERWHEIATLNRGRVMSDGRVFRSEDVIVPGWELILPAGSTSATADARVHTVEPGDTLSGIAAETTGDPSNYLQLFEESQRIDQPVPLENPDLIHPGQQIVIPPEEARAPTPPVPLPEDPQATSADGQRDDGNSIGPSRHAGVPPTVNNDAVMQSASDAADEAPPTSMPWMLAAFTGAGALLAGALVIATRRRDRILRRFRRPGQVRSIPSTDRNVERSVLAAGRASAPTVTTLDRVLRELAAEVSERAPQIQAVEMTMESVHLHLREPMPPPDGSAWTASSDVLTWSMEPRAVSEVDESLNERPAAWPLLVTVGHDDADSTWLLNVEDCVWNVIGDQAASEDFARFVAAEVACNPWAEDVHAHLVDIATETTRMSPGRLHVSDLESAAREVVEHAKRSAGRLIEDKIAVSTARARNEDPDTWPSRLLILRGTRDTVLGELVSLVDKQDNTAAAALLLVGPAANVRSTTVTIDENRRIVIPGIEPHLHAVGLSAEEARGCASLLAQGENENSWTSPPPAGGETWRQLATATGSLREEYRTPRQSAADDDASTLLPPPDADYVSVGATTAEDLDAVAPRVANEVSDEVIARDPTLEADLADWNDPGTPRPKLRLLGPVKARTSGSAQAVAGRQGYYTELFAYLATRPRGATRDDVSDAFGLSTDRVRKDINVLRDWLGKDYVPDARQTPAAHTRGTPVYQVVNELVDVDLFQRLRLRGEATGEIEDLVAALDLVQGEPFSELRPDGWNWMFEGDRLDQHMVCAIVDVAHAIVTHSLAEGDLDQARATIEIAAAAAPDEEIVHLDLAAFLEAEGKHVAAEGVLRSRVIDRRGDGAPLDLPQRTNEVIRNKKWLDRRKVKKPRYDEPGQAGPQSKQ